MGMQSEVLVSGRRMRGGLREAWPPAQLPLPPPTLGGCTAGGPMRHQVRKEELRQVYLTASPCVCPGRGRHLYDIKKRGKNITTAWRRFLFRWDIYP